MEFFGTPVKLPQSTNAARRPVCRVYPAVVAVVVVAEDNLDHQRVIAEVVRRLGHDVVVANDGEAGLAAVRRHRPVLLVADVDMPRLTGLELSRTIHEDPSLSGIRVVLVTAYLLPGDPRLTRSGAAGVIGKPFGVPDLSEALRRHIDEAMAAPEVPEQLLLEALLDCLDTGVSAVDAAGRVLLMNRALHELFDEDRAPGTQTELGGRHSIRRPDGTPLPQPEWPTSRALQGERVDGVELLAADMRGHDRWYRVNARPVYGQGGAVVAAVAAVHDHTAQHRARQYRKCKDEVLKVLATDPAALDAGDRMLAAIGKTLGWPHLRLWLVDEVTDRLRPAATYVGAGGYDLPTPAGVERGEALAGRCWESGEILWVPDVRAPDSPILPQVLALIDFPSAGAVPVCSGDRVIGVITYFATGRQDADPTLGMLLAGVAGSIGAFLEHRRAEVLSMHLAASTDEYIALVGHELRTPLTSIGSYIDLIAESPEETTLGEVRDLFEVVQRNSDRLRDLVERLLDLAALESGHVPIASDKVDLATLVIEAIGGHTGTRAVTVEADRIDQVTVAGDERRLFQVLENLLGNAVKFSPPDTAVTVTLADEGDVAALTITDRGVGIPAQEQSRLFRRLHRGGNVRHTGIPGAGLGLAFCRVVVERHHGTIALSSHESTGTTVTVRLPK
jgi:signal transduction histidine kinase/CheY-like chemotaxis protein